MPRLLRPSSARCSSRCARKAIRGLLNLAPETAVVCGEDGAWREAPAAGVALGALRVGSPVNLERPVRLEDRLGGHLVQGHVDAVGEVLAFDRAGESMLLRVRAPAGLAKYVARKGSICVDGVSLTVNRVEGDAFEINLIPHTLEATTLSRLERGARVNLEIDLIARYVERMLSSR